MYDFRLTIQRKLILLYCVRSKYVRFACITVSLLFLLSIPGNNFLGTVDTDSSLQFPSEHEGERTFLVVIAGEQLEGNGTEFIWTLYIVLGFHGIREEFSLQVDYNTKV
jgi:hypothetical protein